MDGHLIPVSRVVLSMSVVIMRKSASSRRVLSLLRWPFGYNIAPWPTRSLPPASVEWMTNRTAFSAEQIVRTSNLSSAISERHVGDNHFAIGHVAGGSVSEYQGLFTSGYRSLNCRVCECFGLEGH